MTSTTFLWLYWIPSWLLGTLILAVFSIFSMIGLLVTRRRMSVYTHKANDLVFNFTAIAGVVYALVVGLIAVATWDKFKSVEAVANDEAYALSNLYLDVDGLPPATAAQMQKEIKDYLNFVIVKEWPNQQRGRPTEGGDTSALSLLSRLAHCETSTDGQRIVLAQALMEVNNFLAKRRARQNALREALPGVLYFLVLGGAVVLLAMTFTLWTEELWLQMALTLALAAMISLVVFLIVAMDHPLWGHVSVSPDAFENVLKSVAR